MHTRSLTHQLHVEVLMHSDSVGMHFGFLNFSLCDSSLLKGKILYSRSQLEQDLYYY